MSGGEYSSNGELTSNLHSHIRFLRLIENAFNSEREQFEFEATEETAVDKENIIITGLQVFPEIKPDI